MCSYLAGLFDAKGHIIISKRDSKVKNLSLSITFNIKDLPLANRLKDVLGFGWIRIKEKENAWFHTIDGLIKVVWVRRGKKYPVQKNLGKDGWLAGFAVVHLA